MVPLFFLLPIYYFCMDFSFKRTVTLSTPDYLLMDLSLRRRLLHNDPLRKWNAPELQPQHVSDL